MEVVLHVNWFELPKFVYFMKTSRNLLISQPLFNVSVKGDYLKRSLGVSEAQRCSVVGNILWLEKEKKRQ